MADAPDNQRPSTKSQRVLACALCQQRKTKCERTRPCSSCTKVGARCVPVHVPRPRRQRFPERVLLDRIRHYEGLLRRHDLAFEPLHAVAGSASQSEALKDEEGVKVKVQGSIGDSPGLVQDLGSRPRDYWSAVKHIDNDLDSGVSDASSPPDVDHAAVNSAWDQLHPGSDLLFFSTPDEGIDLSLLHPPQIQIFKLWQVYLDNIHPLLMVTHAPTLQNRILDAAGALSMIEAPLEALMFSIYCVATMSLTESECSSVLATSRNIALARFRYGARQALQKCEVLRCDAYDSLAALYLYLVSVRDETDPRSLASLLAIAVRTAQRIALPFEPDSAKYGPLECEQRRRLWWSLVTFDHRIIELTGSKGSMLIPTWNCKPPLNINDSDLRPEMKLSPRAYDRPTEALFVAVRSQLYDCIRRCTFHLDDFNPALRRSVDSSLSIDLENLALFERQLDETYFKDFDQHNATHLMTVNMTKMLLAKCRLLIDLALRSIDGHTRPARQRDQAVVDAITMLDCHTVMMTSTLLKGFCWLTRMYFPFPAYMHLAQDLRARPLAAHADSAWRSMNANYEARVDFDKMGSNEILFRVFAKQIVPAWQPRAQDAERRGVECPVPKLVAVMLEKLEDLKTRRDIATNSVDSRADTVTPMVASAKWDMDFRESPATGDFSGSFQDGIDDHLLGQYNIEQGNWAILDWYGNPGA